MDALPKQFLSSLRILFDILDENRTGLIRLQDIESRWSDDGVRGLPPGVVDGLRKVTPPNGLLSFDRFVAGLKLVLVKRRDSTSTDTRKPLASKENQFIPSYSSDKVSQTQRVQAYSQSTEPNHQQFDRFQHQGNAAKSAREDYNVNHFNPGQQRSGERIMAMAKRFDQQRHHSDTQDMPGNIPSPIHHPSSPTYNTLSVRDGNAPGGQQPQSKAGKNLGQFRRPLGREHEQQGRPPAIPPRSDRMPRVSLQQSQMRKSQSGPDLASQVHSPPAVPPRHASNHVIADLKNWQAGWQGNSQQSHQPNPRGQRTGRRGGSASPTNRSPNHDHAIYANLDEFRSKAPVQQPARLNQPQPSQQQGPQPGPQRATVRRHGSGRRHTLSNGIDQNMLRRMKQLEEETSILHAGLTMLDSARDWYKRQLAAVADKQAMLGKVSYNDNSVEAHQERMNFQRGRIAEVNQHLKTLIDSSEKGFPLHMNLAMSSGLRLGGAIGSGQQDSAASARELQGLKEQNRQLQLEASQRREQLGQLEREKASLVRDLFEARAKNRPSHDDTTFM